MLKDAQRPRAKKPLKPFIAKAIKHKGALRAQAFQAGQMTKRGTIKVSYLNKLKKTGTPLEKKRANLALTLRKIRAKK